MGTHMIAEKTPAAKGVDSSGTKRGTRGDVAAAEREQQDGHPLNPNNMGMQAAGGAPTEPKQHGHASSRRGTH
jgi:hypothetical protein